MSGITYESETGDGLGRFEIDLGDGRSMTVNVTSEGIIMDVWGSHEPGTEPWTNNETGIDHTHLGTAGMMFNEWADWAVDTLPSRMRC